jgi:hypothetical protein
MHRFTDIEPISKRPPPVLDYLTYQLQSLQEALKPILPCIDQLDHFIKTAENECHFPSEHGLSRDESAAIFLYTMERGEQSFYQIINRALWSEDRNALKPWFAYLKLFTTAIQKLPPVQMTVWCGVKEDIAQNFKKADEFVWWSIRSCSTSSDVVRKLLGPNSTLFQIETLNGKDVSIYSSDPNETEVIVSLGTHFRVMSDASNQSPLRLVHLQETVQGNEAQLSSSAQTRTVTNLSRTASNQTTMTF